MKQTLKIILLSSAIFYQTSVFAAVNYNENMVLDSNNSVVSFATIKKQYVVEPAKLDIEGAIRNNTVKLNINVDSVDTMVPIRNTRLKQLFFESNMFPSIDVSAKIDKKMFKFDSFKRTVIPFKVTIFGNSKTMNAEVLIAKTYRKGLVIASTKPMIISASDFGIPADNLARLAETVGGIAISSKVPVNFVLTFNHK